ncbi:hypothetical protein [Profundibacter sp.]
MTKRKSTFTQAELIGYGKAMNEVGQAVWSVEMLRPDGTRVVFQAGGASETANPIDDMLGTIK